MLAPLPEGLTATRRALHRVAAHVMARRRHALVGRIGLRAAPGGFATPAAGPDHEVLRVSGCWLLRERTGEAAGTTAIDLRLASLAEAARFAEVDLADPFSVGDDTPEIGDPHEPLGVDDAGADALASWLAFGWTVLDTVVAEDAAQRAPTVLQLWPEHFDAGLDVDVGDGRRANLGASLGDDGHPAPYLYVGPWGAERPGDPAYWNAPFGAVLGHAALGEAEDPPARALDFVRTGLACHAPGHTG
jgi:hypothetical protein